MQSKATSPEAYITEMPEERKEAFKRLRNTILENIPKGFKEEMNYGMIGYIVPHSLYPAGYHCNPKLPLPYAAIASQKKFITFYAGCLYSNNEIKNWFISEYPKHSKHKLDMGKSCIRFKKPETIPFELLGQLIKKMSVAQWITQYELSRKY
ncbi:MAG: hypothetical protein CVU03_00890 [Bacteroidetes bacterium HGW-Bacteroidetes-2]|jgi:uncharacterized protein YdhG (YjbR/CyaY superfamily)|nr:MAG: hypothetical protein CVU03_00890 [Bacteroidetes bacterium HGW-Bacteroidetes-2]